MYSAYREAYDDAFRDLCKLWAKYLDPDFSPIPASVPNHYKPLPHTVGNTYRALHPL